MTRGKKSSEYKALRACFIAGLCLAVYGLYKEANLSDLAMLIPAISSPFMVYAGCRSHVKSNRGEDD